ncbi:hypothetical protein LNAOJCKE_4682 [Methylorubrum aminovorans]|jgi:hypothetical protein|uniref:Uncharacterized protein n=3 Tax=Methylobacteriaceae TaxID=119045 RepID=A0AA37HQY2_9HYPH|nr:hypothetical protein [Methylorubrum rhodesianum]MDQ0521573.1 hypothetical protein [Methylobacterium gregans]GJD90819.1 hypothetical protein BHAOGJBA_4362 [Methylobacterium hispanicum]GJE67451.1 hypothetical protein LNAOJCKE_4682 [Methylorubrum aminovorans]GJE69049.1 hypothetical protein CHKEEEPN_0572 [Methylorubrum podarium]
MKGSDTIMEEEQFRGDKKIDYTCTIISRPLPV